jgi:hypothetical protein
MTSGWTLVLGRILAVLQGAIWFASLSGTTFRVGWLFGLLAVAAAIAARRLPTRSAVLLLAPAGFAALVELTGFVRSPPAPDLVDLSRTAILVLPGVIGAALIRSAAQPTAASGSSTSAGESTHVPIRLAVAFALVLALISIVPVALSLQLSPPADVLANNGWSKPPIDWRPIGGIESLALTTIVVLVAALIGGAIGGFVWRSGRIRGGVAALASAWATAIIVMPLSAAALGIELRTGIVCIFGCEALLRDDQPFGGLLAYVEFLIGTAALAWPLIILSVIVVTAVTVAEVLRRRSADGSQSADGAPPVPARRIQSRRAVLLILAGFAVAHGSGIALTAASGQTGVIPYICLSLGVLAWAAWMDLRSLRLPSPGPSGADGWASALNPAQVTTPTDIHAAFIADVPALDEPEEADATS